MPAAAWASLTMKLDFNDKTWVSSQINSYAFGCKNLAPAMSSVMPAWQATQAIMLNQSCQVMMDRYGQAAPHCECCVFSQSCTFLGYFFSFFFLFFTWTERDLDARYLLFIRCGKLIPKGQYSSKHLTGIYGTNKIVSVFFLRSSSLHTGKT